MKTKLSKNSKPLLSFFLPPVILALAGILVYFIEASGNSSGHYEYIPRYIFAAAFCAVIALMSSRLKEKAVLLFSFAAVLVSVAAFIKGFSSASYSIFSPYMYLVHYAINANVIAYFSMLGLGQFAGSSSGQKYKWIYYLLFAVPVILTALQTGFEEMFIITMTVFITFTLAITSDLFVRRSYVYIIIAAVLVCIVGTGYIVINSNVALDRIAEVIFHFKNGLFFDFEYVGFDDTRRLMNNVIMNSSLFPNAWTKIFSSEQISYLESGFYFLPKLLAVYGWGVFLIVGAVIINMLKMLWSKVKNYYLYGSDQIIVKMIAIFFTVRTVLAYVSFFCFDKVVTSVPFTSPSVAYLLVDFGFLGIFFATCRTNFRLEKEKAQNLDAEEDELASVTAKSFDSKAQNDAKKQTDYSSEREEKKEAASSQDAEVYELIEELLEEDYADVTDLDIFED